MSQSNSYLVKAKCSGCGRTSAPRVLGTAPPGWRKFVAPPLGAVTYRCDECLRTR